MAREERIRVSSEEKQLLDEKRTELFGTDEVPYGAVVAELCQRL